MCPVVCWVRGTTGGGRGSVGMVEMPDVARPWQGMQPNVSGVKPGRRARCASGMSASLYVSGVEQGGERAALGVRQPRYMCPAWSRAASALGDGYVRLVVCVRRGGGRRKREGLCPTRCMSSFVKSAAAMQGCVCVRKM